MSSIRSSSYFKISSYILWCLWNVFGFFSIEYGFSIIFIKIHWFFMLLNEQVKLISFYIVLSSTCVGFDCHNQILSSIISILNLFLEYLCLPLISLDYTKDDTTEPFNFERRDTKLLWIIVLTRGNFLNWIIRLDTY